MSTNCSGRVATLSRKPKEVSVSLERKLYHFFVQGFAFGLYKQTW